MRLLIAAFPFVRFLDVANLLTTFNIALSLMTTMLALRGSVALASAAMCLATMIDFADGHLARTLLADRFDNRAFGKQLDSLSDLLNFSVAPALVVIQLSAMPMPQVAAGLLVMSGALRLAFFGATAVPCPTRYVGLPTTYAGFLLAVLFQWACVHGISDVALTGAVTLVAAAQVSRIRFPKSPALPAMLTIPLAYGALTWLIRH